MKVSIAEAKAKPSELLRRLAVSEKGGEEVGEVVTTTQRGQPVAVLHSPRKPLPSRAAWRAEQEPPKRSVVRDLCALRDKRRHE